MKGNTVVKWTMITLALIFFAIFGVVLGVGLYAANALQPPEPAETQVRFTIAEGVNSEKIAHILQEQGLIKDATMFKLYLHYKGQGDRFQAGEYELQPGIALDQIISVLNNGETVPKEMMHFTIPEGYTIEQMAEKLAKDGILDPVKFIELADLATGLTLPSEFKLPEHPEIIHRLEGYLFPETYELFIDSEEIDILNRMLQELDKKLTTLPLDWKKQAAFLGVDPHQMLTIASLIEREVVVDSERPIVAGVIYNRLRQEMPLQIDATVQYLMEEQKEQLFEKDLQIESPYNTYLHQGLPPGPIASPSLSSIRAALYPEDSDFLFYVTKKDGSGEHMFAKTYEEHKKNIAESKLNGK